MPGPYEYPGVYIEELPAGSRPIQGVSTAVAAFIGLTEFYPEDKADNFGRPFLVTDWEQYRRLFGGFVEYEDKIKKDGGDQNVPTMLCMPISVYGYFQNGGGRCYVESLGAYWTREAAQKAADAAKSTKQLTETLPATGERKLTLKGRGAGIGDVLAFEPKVGGAITITVAENPNAGDELFKLTISSEGKDEPYEDLTLGRGNNNVVTRLRGSNLVKVRQLITDQLSPDHRPAVETKTIEAAPLAKVQASGPIAVPKPAPPEIKTKEIPGSLNERKGIGGLEAIEEITMVCMPDLMEWARTEKITAADAIGLQGQLVAHCELKKDRLAILDTPSGLTVQQMQEWRNALPFTSAFAALYYPWILIQNPAGKGQFTVPPSGHIAGLYARVDRERGVHKAPANEKVTGAVGLALQINNQEQATLNPIAVNCIRAFPNRGILVWGARTLVEQSSEWRYINVRRLFNYIEESIYEGIQWAVFEPNDMDLWERVKRSITAFLTGVWRSGALFGATPQEAFYVKCDAELNPSDVRDRGELIVEVGLAPVKPAEFVVIRFRQIPGGGEVTE